MHILGLGAKFHDPLWLMETEILPEQAALKWTSNDNSMTIGEETFTSEALNQVRYIKADFKQMLKAALI